MALYRPNPADPTREADPTELAARPELAEIAFAYPRVVDRFSATMEFALAVSEGDWVPGAYRLPEPRRELPAVPLGEIDAFVVPGVAFGRNGERIGRGMGYYDRVLARAPGALRIGFAFETQVAEALAQSPWDQRMDWIVTEAGAFAAGKR